MPIERQKELKRRRQRRRKLKKLKTALAAAKDVKTREQLVEKIRRLEPFYQPEK